MCMNKVLHCLLSLQCGTSHTLQAQKAGPQPAILASQLYQLSSSAAGVQLGSFQHAEPMFSLVVSELQTAFNMQVDAHQSCV